MVVVTGLEHLLQSMVVALAVAGLTLQALCKSRIYPEQLPSQLEPLLLGALLALLGQVAMAPPVQLLLLALT